MNNKIINNTLYIKNKKEYIRIKKEVKTFNALYNGNNIIQDDIYNMLKNYALRNGKYLDVIRVPIHDDDFWAFTCLREGRLFVVINSALPINKQIFACAHEMYHVWCYISKNNNSLAELGSLLTKDDIYNPNVTKEDIEANAFAGMILVPDLSLREQMQIYDISNKRLNVDSIVRLMDIFAVPFKAIVLRLFEEELITERKANELLESITDKDIKRAMEKYNVGLRWQKEMDNEIDFGLFKNMFEDNKERGLLSSLRVEDDEKQLEKIEDWFLRK